MEEIFRFADKLGPTKILHVYEPSTALKAILVVDNVAAGPAIGGLRMAPDVGLEECVRLARAMTLKNAMAGLPHGGGKSVLFGNPKMPAADKETLIRALAGALRDIHEYIVGPDMGTNEQCMAWMRDETGRAVGLPRELGGIPLDEIGITGWGVSHSAIVAAPYCGIDINGARVVVQGYGAVGRNAARFLVAEGAVLVGASDSRGAISQADGLDIDALDELKAAGGSVTDYQQGEKLARDAVLDLECDIWIPAARPDVLRAENVTRLNTKLVVQGANIPATDEAETWLHHHDILSIPDFVANAGGVISAALEYRGANEAMVFSTVEETLVRNTRLVLEQAVAKKIMPRQAALQIARRRVETAMATRRWSVFASAPGAS